MSARFTHLLVRSGAVASSLLFLMVAATSCTEDAGVVEPPGPPPAPAVIGFDSARPGAMLTLCVEPPGGGSGLEYQFDFDIGGQLTGWSADSCQTHGWAFEGKRVVRARVRRGTLVSAWSVGWTVTIIDETVTPPNQPTSDGPVIVGQNIQFCGAGAVSSKAHPIEYRFRVDPEQVMDWHISRCASVPWTLPGAFRVRAQARCVLHKGIISLWSQSVEFVATSGADTRVVQVLSAPSPGATPIEINFLDAIPDTLPLGSWATLVVEGSSPAYTNGTCSDPVNRCVGFQMQYQSARSTVPAATFISPWLPVEPFDGNTAGLRDTVRMNIGSVDYDIRTRAVDEFGADAVPASLSLIGNLAPTLDDFALVRHDGTIIGDEESVAWDWWAPENTDTLDLIAGERKKQFSFIIKASGHDNPREPAGSGIKGWRYLFSDAEAQVMFFPLARAGFSYVEALQVNTLCDTFTWTVRYPVDDVNGDTVFDVPPEWINRRVVFSVRGRDTAPDDTFQQLTRLNGQQQLVDQYNLWDFGRRTGTGTRVFFIGLQR